MYFRISALLLTLAIININIFLPASTAASQYNTNNEKPTFRLVKVIKEERTVDTPLSHSPNNVAQPVTTIGINGTLFNSAETSVCIIPVYNNTIYIHIPHKEAPVFHADTTFSLNSAACYHISPDKSCFIIPNAVWKTADHINLIGDPTNHLIEDEELLNIRYISLINETQQIMVSNGVFLPPTQEKTTVPLFNNYLFNEIIEPKQEESNYSFSAAQEAFYNLITNTRNRYMCKANYLIDCSSVLQQHADNCIQKIPCNNYLSRLPEELQRVALLYTYPLLVLTSLTTLGFPSKTSPSSQESSHLNK